VFTSPLVETFDDTLYSCRSNKSVYQFIKSITQHYYRLKSSLSSSICTHKRNVLLLRNLHIQFPVVNAYKCKVNISTQSMYEIQVTRIKLSNSISSSNFLNTNQMLIYLFLSKHFYTLQFFVTGNENFIICFHCCLTLTDWKKMGSLLQHGCYSPRCIYFQHPKGACFGSTATENVSCLL